MHQKNTTTKHLKTNKIMEILIDFLGHFTIGVIIGIVIAIIYIKLYKTFKNK